MNISREYIFQVNIYIYIEYEYFNRLFPKQCLHYGVLAFSRLVNVWRPRAVPGHIKSLKNLKVLTYFKKNGAGARVLDSTFSFFEECFS